MRKILTTYRCNNCWIESLARLRTLVASGEDEIQMSFCDFLARRGFTKDSETIRVAPLQQRKAYLFAVIDAVQAGDLVFEP
jgi:hypothetical protein